MPTIVNSVQLFGTLNSSYLLSKYGRKDLFILGGYGMSISLFAIFLGLMIQDSLNGLGTFLILVGLGACSIVFGMTIGPCTWLYISEIADPEVVPYAAALNRLAAVLSITLFPIVTASLLNGDCNFIFLFFSAIMLYFSFFYKKYLI
jgi:MFS family permease